MKRVLMLFSICAMAITGAFAQDDAYYTGDAATVTVRVTVAPPELPVYEQPPCPYDGYLWSPGYWAWSPDGYYWVPGVWVRPPHVGFLWTPGYWGFIGGEYGWHDGYWGEHIGYYGGVCYGFGYEGTGFYGGRWEGGAFRYNTAVWHVNNNAIHHTYSEGVRNTVVSHASYNGPGGVQAHPIGSEQQAMRENHVAATSEQQSHQKAAVADKNQFVSANHGKPAVAAMNTPNGQRFNIQGHPTGGNVANHQATPAAPGNKTAPVNNNGRPAQAPANNNQRPVQMQNQPHTGPAPVNRPAPANNNQRPVQMQNQRPVNTMPNNRPAQQPTRNNAPPQQTAPRNNMPQQRNMNQEPNRSAPQQQPRMQAPPQQQQPRMQQQQPQQQPHMQAPQQQPRMQAPPQQQQPHMQAPQGRPAEPAGHPGERR